MCAISVSMNNCMSNCGDFIVRKWVDAHYLCNSWVTCFLSQSWIIYSVFRKETKLITSANFLPTFSSFISVFRAAFTPSGTPVQKNVRVPIIWIPSPDCFYPTSTSSKFCWGPVHSTVLLFLYSMSVKKKSTVYWFVIYEKIVIALVHYFICTGWAKKRKVCNSFIWWRRKAFAIPTVWNLSEIDQLSAELFTSWQIFVRVTSCCDLDLWPLGLELLCSFGRHVFKLCVNFE